MVTIIKEKNSIKLDKGPVVVFPLEEWKKIEETLENLEDAVRFNNAYQESRGQKLISLEELKKRYNLK